MGEIDIRMKNFVKINSVFAQLFSYGVFKGELDIDPEKLRELDTVLQETVRQSDGKPKSVERLRDAEKIGKVFDDKISFQIILGIENQSGANYYMPVRCMELDALAYSQQCRKISERAKEKHKIKKYADGVPKGTKVIPIVTLVFYYGSRVWDGPISVYDMLDIPEEKKERMREIVPDYRMNLFDAKHMSDEEIEVFEGDLKAFLLMLRDRYDPERLKTVIAAHRETWYTIGAVKRDKRYIEYIDTVSDEELKGGVCMDATLDFIEARGRRQGEAIGKAKGVNKVNQLILFLTRDKRTEDIIKSAEDVEYQKKLFIEYGLDQV